MIINGLKIAQEEKEKTIEKCKHLTQQLNRTPELHVILVGDNPASHIYVNNKKKKCQEVGIQSVIHNLSPTTCESELIHLIHKLNTHKSCDGILVQLPLPKEINTLRVIDSISPLKDVDGLHALNLGHLVQGRPQLIPCTPLGCLHLINTWKKDISGLQAVIIGRSILVGKPLSFLLEQSHATLTLVHSKSKNISQICKQADILIAACGIPHFVDDTFVKEGACIIDVGINRLENGKIIGDVNFDLVYEKASAITPVPGGVGPMTISYLLANTLKAVELQHFSSHMKK